MHLQLALSMANYFTSLDPSTVIVMNSMQDLICSKCTRSVKLIQLLSDTVQHAKGILIDARHSLASSIGHDCFRGCTIQHS